MTIDYGPMFENDACKSFQSSFGDRAPGRALKQCPYNSAFIGT